LNASDSAFYALTDFELDFPITVDIERTISEASRTWIDWEFMHYW